MTMIYIDLEKDLEDETVFSAHLRKIGYDREQQLLEVKFWNGWIYQYYDVSYSIWQRFLKVKSKGKFLWRNVRPIYNYARIA